MRCFLSGSDKDLADQDLFLVGLVRDFFLVSRFDFGRGHGRRIPHAVFEILFDGQTPLNRLAVFARRQLFRMQHRGEVTRRVAGGRALNLAVDGVIVESDVGRGGRAQQQGFFDQAIERAAREEQAGCFAANARRSSAGKAREQSRGPNGDVAIDGGHRAFAALFPRVLRAPSGQTNAHRRREAEEQTRQRKRARFEHSRASSR